MTETVPYAGRVPSWTLGERIRKAREDQGWTQQEFADVLGVDRKSCGSWEAGRHQPRYRDLIAIAQVTGVDLHWLAEERFRPLTPVGERVERAAVRDADSERGAGRDIHRYRQRAAA